MLKWKFRLEILGTLDSDSGIQNGESCWHGSRTLMTTLALTLTRAPFHFFPCRLPGAIETTVFSGVLPTD